MAFVFTIITLTLGAIIAGALIDRALHLPDGPRKQAFYLSFPGLLALWLAVFMGFCCGQFVYASLTGGGFLLSHGRATRASWLILMLAAFGAALGSWWARRVAAARKP